MKPTDNRIPELGDVESLAIDVTGLVRRFGDTTAVNGLVLQVRRGEMFGLVGPDGAGKSTVIRLLCGILSPTEGTGMVLGLDMRRDPENIKSKIGYLSQNFTLYGDLTVDENIEFFAELHGVGDFRKRRDELLGFTRLTPFRKRRADALSGGMKKKLALACTLIHTPDLILLDEPSTGVDPVSRGEFWTILSGILEQGVTIFMTTPYLDEAERCHRVGLMHRGQIFITGTPDEIMRTMPGVVYEMRCAAPAAAYQAMRKRWPSEQLVLYGECLHFWTEGGELEVRKATAWLKECAVETSGFSPASPTLEDAFVAWLSSDAMRQETAQAGAKHE